MSAAKHLLACWPRNYLNAHTRTVCEWTGWGFDGAVANMTELVTAGTMHMRRQEVDGRPAIYPSGKFEGKPMHFWTRPDGAHGLPPVEDLRLALVGIARALTDGHRVIYQGEKPLEVYRRGPAMSYAPGATAARREHGHSRSRGPTLRRLHMHGEASTRTPDP